MGGIRYTVYGIRYTVYGEYMPKTTVYIRDKDWDKWKVIANKAEMISKAINQTIPENKIASFASEDVVYEEFEG